MPLPARARRIRRRERRDRPTDRRGGRHDRGRVTIVQSDFGTKPFSVMDARREGRRPVEVQIEAKLRTG
jgi:hypothetical protein